MSIQIEATYSKKLGLPNFSSHSFMVSVRAEISSIRRIEPEAARLYQLLQSSVDKQVQEAGFIPDATNYGLTTNSEPHRNAANGSSPEVALNGTSRCSDKQRNFISTTAKRMQLSEDDLDSICNDLFKVPAKQLDKRQASQLIDKLFEMDGRVLAGVRRNGRGRNGSVGAEH